jgi:putative ABC transport system permease protein
VIAVIALVANAILLMVRGRVKENAVLRTLGYPARAIMFLVVSEGGLLGLAGGILGAGLAWGFLRWQSFTMGSEGHTLAILPEISTALFASVAALVLGVVASIHPALVAIRQPIVKSLRS